MAHTDVDQEVFQRNNEIAQSRRTGGGPDYWKPKVAAVGKSAERNVIRILPPHENMNRDPFVAVKMHFLPSKEMSKDGRPIPITINCLSEYGKECPACHHVDRLFREAKSEDDPEAAAQIERQAKDQSAKLRIFCSIVDMEHADKGVQRYGFPPEVEKKLRMCFYDDDLQFRNITHSKTGRDVLLFVGKKGTTDFNEYSARVKENPSPLRDMDWLDQIPDLSELRVEPTEADVMLALKGERPKSALPTSQKPATEKKPTPRAEAPAPKAEAPAPRPKRQPVSEEEEAPAAKDPWSIGRAVAVKAGFSEFTEVAPEEVERIKKPNCYSKEADPTDSMCQGCRVLLPCLTLVTKAKAA